MDGPSHTRENASAANLAVAASRGAIEVGAVAFDREDEPFGLLRMANSDIDAIAANAHTRYALESVGSGRVDDDTLERAEREGGVGADRGE